MDADNEVQIVDDDIASSTTASSAAQPARSAAQPAKLVRIDKWRPTRGALTEVHKTYALAKNDHEALRYVTITGKSVAGNFTSVCECCATPMKQGPSTMWREHFLGLATAKKTAEQTRCQLTKV